MQTISFLVKNHLKRDKNSKKKNHFFPLPPAHSLGYPQDPDPDPHEKFARIRIRKKKCESETLDCLTIMLVSIPNSLLDWSNLGFFNLSLSVICTFSLTY